MTRRFVLLCWLALATLAWSLPAAAQTAGTARVRVIHASPDTPPMDLFVDNQPVLRDVPFAVIGDYQDWPAGSHTIAVAPAGQGIAAATASERLDLEAGTAYSLAVVLLNNRNFVQLTDYLTAPPAGKARVRVLHFSPDAPGADVEVINGPKLAQNVAFGTASPYQTVDATAYDLRLVTSGNNTVIVQLPATTLNAGTIYDAVAIGRLAAIQVELASFTPSASAAQSAPQLMPNVGATSNTNALLVLGLLTMLAGFALRRRAA
ncbi:MAG: DUF4397 domain-containing protein [Chloroflexi bacterium]|nr:DUF4397 domain-containing protein [Chloroflexota bacterium]